jgi:hypothetical protein
MAADLNDSFVDVCTQPTVVAAEDPCRSEENALWKQAELLTLLLQIVSSWRWFSRGKDLSEQTGKIGLEFGENTISHIPTKGSTGAGECA